MESYSSAKKDSWLSWFLKGLLILGTLVLLGRLAELQIIKGEYYKSLSEGNRIKRVNIQAPRGKILDRGGNALATNRQTKKTIEIPDGQIEISSWEREYPVASVAAHVVGYLGEANEDEVGKPSPACQNKGVRSLGSAVGRGGLEQQYDCQLRGVDGEELIEVDSLGRKVRLLGRKEPIPGEDLATTLDIKLQKRLASAMEGKLGAAVVSDPSGQILALYSAPSFNPKDISQSLSDPALPLFNRALSGLYSPGSIFKMVAAIGALEDEAIKEDFTYVDTGQIVVNDFSYTNWFFTQNGGVEGEIGLKRAIARSTDTFFYKVGEIMGIDSIVKWSQAFGLDKPSNIDLPGELPGLVPTPAWKKAVKGERWFLGNTYHLSIGQGDMLLTPIRANSIASVIAARGRLCDPKINSTTDSKCQDLNISQNSLDIIKEGMILACQPGGTAFPFFNFEPQTACKTGTAETGLLGETHAWFTAFAPADNPELVITVLVEKGGGGSDIAAPVAKDIFDFYFNP